MNASATSLVLRRGNGWTAGMGTMLAKENASWWRTRKWWINSLAWLAILNGTLAVNLTAMNGINSLGVFLQMAAILLPIGAISLAQDSIFRERHSGTAAWVLTKPLARPSFVLAKAVANALGFLATAVALPSLAAWIQAAIFGNWRFPAAGYVGFVGLIYLNAMFYLALALMLATFFNSRGPVLAIALGLDLGWLFIQGLIMKHAAWLVDIMPWTLGMPVGWKKPLANALLMGASLPTLMPIVATAGWTVLFILVAVWRFRREEF